MADRSDYHKRWYQENRERVRERQAAYYADNRDEALARAERSATANPERTQATKRRWQDEGRATYRVQKRRNEASRRARKRDAFVEVVDPLVVLERDDGLCGICGTDVDPSDFHIDHIQPLARGGEHSYANSQLAHPVCNLRKGVK